MVWVGGQDEDEKQKKKEKKQKKKKKMVWVGGRDGDAEHHHPNDDDDHHVDQQKHSLRPNKSKRFKVFITISMMIIMSQPLRYQTDQVTIGHLDFLSKKSLQSNRW